jgi:cbb3-type cytochrome oxidase subunit 3
MLIVAVRTYEPWTLASVLGGLVLLGCLLGVLIFALRRVNR